MAVLSAMPVAMSHRMASVKNPRPAIGPKFCLRCQHHGCYRRYGYGSYIHPSKSAVQSAPADAKLFGDLKRPNQQRDAGKGGMKSERKPMQFEVRQRGGEGHMRQQISHGKDAVCDCEDRQHAPEHCLDNTFHAFFPCSLSAIKKVNRIANIAPPQVRFCHIRLCYLPIRITFYVGSLYLDPPGSSVQIAMTRRMEFCFRSVGVCAAANSTRKIKSSAGEGLLRSPALSLASQALATSERFQLPRPSLKRWKRKRALCQQFAGQA